MYLLYENISSIFNFSYDEGSSRLYIEGFLSHIKGCNWLRLTYFNETRRSVLFQKNLNPSVYTKLSCHLPWIAEQYDMDYDHNEEIDLECVQGTGDLLQMENCRSDNDNEDPCIFPFYWNYKFYEECTMFDDDEFIWPVFYCPIRNITRKINGTNSFIYEDVRSWMCPALEQEEDSLELIYDPDRKDCDFSELAEFQSEVAAHCKNNCRGVNFSVVSGGAALVATGALAATSFSPGMALLLGDGSNYIQIVIHTLIQELELLPLLLLLVT